MSWLAMNVGPLLAGLIIFFVVKYAFRWAQAGPWGAFLLMATAWLVVQGARLAFVPTLDSAYADFREQTRDSQIGADAARLLSAAPQDLGFSGEGAQSALFPSVGEVPTVEFATEVPGETPSTTDIGGGFVPEPQPAPAYTSMEFAPTTVTARGTTLTLIREDTVQVISVDGVSLAACGWDLERGYGSDSKPLYLLACPASQGTVFPLAEVYLSASFPLPPVAVLPTPFPTPATMSEQELNRLVGVCWLKWASDVGFSSVTERFGTQALPIDTTWRLKGPGDWQTAWNTAAGEVWHLTSDPLGVIDYPVTGSWARSIANNDDSATVIVKGAGNFCQP